MRGIIDIVILSLCACLAAPFARASAQASEKAPTLLERPAPMQGYYLTVGLQGGLLYARDEGKSQQSLGGASLSLHLGQAVTTWMDLGVVLELGSVVAGDRSGGLVSFGFDWTIRPVRTLFFRVSPAIGFNQLSAVARSDNTANTFGTVVGLTMGYALFPFYKPKQSGGFAVSPVVHFSAVQPFNDSAAYWMLAGLEINWWSGLPREQLDVPLQEVFACRDCAGGL